MGRPEKIPVSAIGTDEPQTPKHSLPSYGEPTPETHRRLTREDEAELALKRTSFTPGTRVLLISLFLITILSVAIIQFVVEARRPNESFSMFNLFKTVRSLPHGEEIKSAEKQLETDSVVSQWLLPPTQSVLTGKLGAGNEQVYLGRDGWLFYRPDVDYVTGPPFLSPARLRQRQHRAGVQADPVKAIVQFRDQLTARGIDLVIVPIPTKPTIEGDKLSARAATGAELQNASFNEFKTRLAAARVRVFDPIPLLPRDGDLYLTTDTHWRPGTMESVAQGLAAALDLPPADEPLTLQTNELETNGVGDVSRMLRLPPNEQLYPPQRVTIHQVTNGDALWRPAKDADVLVLGDSFANIFSIEALGWGESAGFVEHLSYSLGGRPLDCILRNSDGAFATREILAHELARGRDRLAGKKLVVWEFAARELAFGNWKLIDLKLGKPGAAQFYSPKSGESVEATGTVENVSLVPRPATAPYKDHIMAVQISDLQIANRTHGEPLQAIVYLWSMRDNVWTPAARLRPGDHVRLHLRAWVDVASQYEQVNRSELEDPALQLEEPVWGELRK
ncbi:MAG: alginate O-acetyltransferase AlgX-related protein [Chthoniobacterales bacterium]